MKLKKLLFFISTVVISLPTSAYGGSPPGFLASDFTYAVSQSDWQEVSILPQLSSKAALVQDTRTGVVILQNQSKERLPIASLTKIMVAYLALQEDWSTEVIVSAEAAAMPETRMGLEAGERITLLDLVYGLLMVSGNDAAAALSDHLGSSEEGFVALMNSKAQELGLADTHFANPQGFDEEGNYSTASDLVALTRAAIFRFPVFASIAATKEFSVQSLDGRTHHLINSNQLLFTYPGVDGIKTGTTEAAGECLVFSAIRDGHGVIGVVLGSEDRWSDAATLLDYVFGNWRWVDLGTPTNAFAQKDGFVLTSEPALIVLPVWALSHLDYCIKLNKGPGASGALPGGTVVFYLGGSPVAELKLAGVKKE